MNTTGIEYLDMTWNPTTGCTPVSAGCEHCWAKSMTERNLWGYDFTPRCHEHRLLEPLGRRKPARIGVSFMGDLFHDGIPDEFIDKVLTVMVRSIVNGFGHQYMILTKRADRMCEYFSAPDLRRRLAAERIQQFITERDVTDPQVLEFASTEFDQYPEDDWPDYQWPLKDIWLGVTAEDQATADERIPLLLQCPAAVRYVSLEPLLEGISLRRHLLPSFDDVRGIFSDNPPTPKSKLDWVIVGGESGPGARPMHPGWVRSLRDQCAAANVPFFFKQWGEWSHEFKTISSPATTLNGQTLYRVGKHLAWRLLDGVLHDAVPGVAG